MANDCFGRVCQARTLNDASYYTLPFGIAAPKDKTWKYLEGQELIRTFFTHLMLHARCECWQSA
jgi:hypothetical protein